MLNLPRPVTPILVAIAVSLSTGPSLGAHADPAAAPKLPADALPLPLVRQATEYSCGPASLLSVLYYWGAYDGSESSLYKKLETTHKEGTEPPKLAEFALKAGLRSELRERMTIAELREALALGRTVILDIQAWRDAGSPSASLPWSKDWDDGHYVVLAGMDQDYAYFMDPSTAAGYAYIPLEELMDRWHDCETRHGYVQRYYQTGIVIQGKQALQGLAPLTRIE